VSFVERLSDPAWRTTALLLLGMVLLIVALRLWEARRIRRKFPRQNIVRIGFGITYFGLDSEPGAPQRILGALVLLKDGLYFRARIASQELHIPGADILHLSLTNTHRGRTLRQYVVGIRFRTPEGRGETAAFRFPRPTPWITAIRATLLEGRA
jgi:hypothetical protein